MPDSRAPYQQRPFGRRTGVDSSTPWPVWGALFFIAWRVHVGIADGGDAVAKMHYDERALAALGALAREHAAPDDPIEVSIAPELESVASEDAMKREAIEKEKKEKAVETPKPVPEKKPEEKVVVVEQKKAEPVPEIPMRKDQRVAIKQHAKSEDDNPNAAHIADEANKVDEETRSTITSHDKDDPNPTIGGNHANASKEPGDSDDHKIKDSDDHAGEKNKAPGEKGSEDNLRSGKPAEKVAATDPQTKVNEAAGRVGGDHRAAARAPTDTPPASSPTESPIENGPGGWSFNPIAKQGAAGTSKGPGLNDPTNPHAGKQVAVSGVGLGQESGAGKTNINLTHANVLSAIGIEQIRKERVADGERRKSEHRGSWVASNFEKWRNAIENYVPSVKAGNTTSLNAARVPFASYLNEIHNKIHPIFADNFLGSLGGLPPTHQLNDQKLMARLEIVLSKEGRIVRVGIVKASGVTAFDVAALDAVDRAQPFGKAPQPIWSPDGNVYLHWEFHRSEQYACSTMNAKPVILATPPAIPKGKEEKKVPAPLKDQNPFEMGGTQHGSLYVLPPKRDVPSKLTDG